MNHLLNYFERNDKRTIHKWDNYFEVYDRHFNRFRKKAPVVVEIGVNFGGSLQMWRDYFGTKATIVGIDINPACQQMRDEGFEIMIGDQEDRTFWKEFRARFPRVDILIDDGGHSFKQQQVTFEEMYEHVHKDGVYLIEDIHTSYQVGWGGGFRKAGTFVEYTKGLIDELNAWWSNDREKYVTKLTKTCKSIHYYDSIVVFEKGERDPPFDRISGKDAARHKTYWAKQDPIRDISGFPEPGSTIK
jgi:hypothetical protein